jgi:hypothetical protein
MFVAHGQRFLLIAAGTMGLTTSEERGVQYRKKRPLPELRRLRCGFSPRRTGFAIGEVHVGMWWTKWHYDMFLLKSCGLSHSTTDKYSIMHCPGYEHRTETDSPHQKQREVSTHSIETEILF